MAILIDDRGAVWPSTPESLRQRFGNVRPWRDFACQAIGLGFIFVTFGPTGVRIALRPPFVTAKAVAQLARTPYARVSERIALSHDGEMSSWVVIAGIRRAIAVIEAVRAAAQSPEPRPLLMAKPLPLEQAASIGRGRLMPVLEAWRQEPVRRIDELYAVLQRAGLLPDAVIFRRAPGSERFVIEHWGSRRDLLGPGWTRIARGRDVLDQPNKQLGEWNAALAAETVATAVPRLLACDYVIRTPEARLIRRTNKRLLLPWRTPEGDALLVNLHGTQRTYVLSR